MGREMVWYLERDVGSRVEYFLSTGEWKACLYSNGKYLVEMEKLMMQERVGELLH